MAIRYWPIKTIRNMYTRYHRCNKHTYQRSHKDEILRDCFMSVFCPSLCQTQKHIAMERQKVHSWISSLFFAISTYTNQKQIKKRHWTQSNVFRTFFFILPVSYWQLTIAIFELIFLVKKSREKKTFRLINCNPLRLSSCLFIFYCDARK